MADNCPHIVIIKRTGADGARFPLRRNECLFGRNTSCDLRVQLPGVALEHAKVVRCEENEFYLEIISDSGTKVNGEIVKERIKLKNMDVFSIAERSFRFEQALLETQEKLKSMVPGKPLRSPKRVSRTPKKEKAQLAKISPLRDANHIVTAVVKDSPRTPLMKGTSLRESMGKLRRSSVPFKEVEESLLVNYETKENERVCVVQKSPSFKVSATPKSANRRNKRVSFGPVLSPEQFDKTLPVSTPVRRGATPRRSSAPLSKPCISPARSRRYSVATPGFISRIVEEQEENSEEDVVNTASESADEWQANGTRRKLATPIRQEIEGGGKRLRGRPKKMATPLKAAIQSGFRLRATKKRLQTPVRKEIEAGKKLRKTRRKMATPLREAIQGRPGLRATMKKMATPVRKEIQSKPALRKTVRKMDGDLQAEIRNGTTLRETKKILAKELQDGIKSRPQLRSTRRKMDAGLQREICVGKELRCTKKKMATPLRKEIAEGVTLRVTRPRMPSALQEDIKCGVGLKPTMKSLRTPLRKEIQNGVRLRETKKKMTTPLRDDIRKGVQLKTTRRRIPSMLQNEIKGGTVELKATKKSLKTPLRKEIEAGVGLKKTQDPVKTPKRRQSSVEETPCKKLKTPGTASQRKSGFFPSSRARRSTARRKSTKHILSYADVLKKARQQRRKTLEKKALVKTEKQIVRKTLPKTADIKKVDSPVAANQARRDKNNEWQVVVDKRKILRIKRQRAAKQEAPVDLNTSGMSELFKTPMMSRARSVRSVVNPSLSQASASPVDDSNLQGVARIMKTPKDSSTTSPNDEHLQGISRVMKTPGMKNVATPNDSHLQGISRIMKTPKAKEAQSDSHLKGISRLMKSPRGPKTCPVEDYEGFEEMFYVPEMESPIVPSQTPSLRKVAEKINVVSPLVATSTPSLRRKSDKMEVIEALSVEKCTPSLRRGVDIVNMASPLSAHKTPSLRKAAATVDVVSPLKESCTPSLRKPASVVVNEATEQAIAEELPRTRSTRSSKRKADVSLAPQAKRTRSTKKERLVTGEIQTTQPKLRPSRSKRVKNKVEEMLTGPTTVEDENIPPIIENDAVVVEAAASPRAVIRRNARSTRSQREEVATVVPETVKSTEKPTRSTRSRAIAKPVETVSKIEPKDATASETTRCVEINETKSRVTRSRRTKTVMPEIPGAVVINAEPVVVESVVPEAEKPAKSKRGRRVSLRVAVEDKHVEISTRKTRGSLKKNVVEEEVVTGNATQVPIDVVLSPEAAVKDGVPSAEVVETEKPMKTRRGRKSKADTDNKKPTRSSRRKPTAKEEPTKPQVVSHTPKPASRSSKNVPGIPETPQPLEYTKTKLETIVEVPTPASSLRGSATKGRSVVHQGDSVVVSIDTTAANKREITTVVEEEVTVGSEVAPMTKRRKVAKATVAESRRSTRSRNTAVDDKSTVKAPATKRSRKQAPSSEETEKKPVTRVTRSRRSCNK